jgi:hypothetical protein
MGNRAGKRLQPLHKKFSNTSRQECSDFDFTASGGYVVNIKEAKGTEAKDSKLIIKLQWLKI